MWTYLYTKITESEYKILLSLAHDGPQSQWQLKEKGIGQYPYIHTLVKRLEKQDFIRVDQVKQSERNVPMKIYRLTLVGILRLYAHAHTKAIFNSQDDDSTRSQALDMSLLARNYRSLLPLIFGKWEYFEEKNIIRIVEDLFSSIVTRFQDSYLQPWYTALLYEFMDTRKRWSRLEWEAFCQKVIYHYFFAPFLLDVPLGDTPYKTTSLGLEEKQKSHKSRWPKMTFRTIDLNKFFEVIHADDELREITREVWSDLKRRYLEEVARIEKLQKHFHITE